MSETTGTRRGAARQTFWESGLDLDFMALRKAAIVLSLVLILGSVAALVVRGLNFGLDFTGGTLVELEFAEAVDPQTVRTELEAAGYADLVVQNFGTPRDVLVRVPPDVVGEDDKVGDEIRKTLGTNHGNVDLRRSEFVGPAVGEELREQGGLAMLTALALVMVYIMFRFTGKFAIGAVVALVHDVIVVLGAFSVFGWSFDLPSLAAVLAVIGYSLNDTIVVYDRLRENFRVKRKGTAKELTNLSINQMLSRTVMTSLTTLLVLIALFYFGGEIIHSFAYTLIVGVVVGTYSSIFVASTAALVLGVSKQDLMPVVKEGADQPDQEDLPARFRNT